MSYEFSEDELPSDRIEEVMAMSLAVRGKQNAVAGPSQLKRRAAPAHSRSRVEPIDELSIIEAELDEVDEEISRLRKLRDSLLAKKQYIIQRQPIASAVSAPTANGKGKAKNGDINYFTEFPWSLGLKAKMKEVFKIDNFRLCQEAVCNANMDMRDIVCVMPTGGGKSLTYQLPALLTPGCTLVISPLISLMSDQLFHLKEAGVEAVMITSETSPGENKAMESRLAAMVSGNTTGQPGIKLCYVTPERIAKNKLFRTLLGKLADVRKLARIVIDEAHCVSQMGHDFRTDYLKLDVLRKLFPSVPIMALSATCPPSVLRDLLNTLGMPPIVDGRAASKKGTVYFSAPLYRANLHYSVVSKPATAKSHLKMMQNYILDNHKGHSGIIYCLTTKEAENVAIELQALSNGQIKTGIYHGKMKAAEKDGIHVRWRTGRVQVVCATIAFGMGIDKADVRFVLHHSISKSIEGFYQESGRAGRDGKDADCVLYYRPQDATRIGQMQEGMRNTRKLHAMLRFAQDMKVCRKVQFAKYFSVSSDLAIAAWTTEDKDALEPCGHCDNCTRAPAAVAQDVREAAWRVICVLDAVNRDRRQVTVAQLGDLARGAGSGMPQGRKGKGRSKENVFFDLNKIAGGKVELSKDDVERLCVHLLVEGYLEEMFQQTPYGVNVYLQSTDLALRLTRFTLGDIQQGKGPPVLCSFPEKGKTKRTDGQAAKEIPSTQGARKANDAGAIRKSPRMSSTSKYTNEDNEEGSSQDESYGNEDAHFIDDSDVDELSTDWWSRSLRDGSVPPGKRKLRSSTGRAQKRQRPTAPDDVIDLEEAADVIVISD